MVWNKARSTFRIGKSNLNLNLTKISSLEQGYGQGLVKGAILCFRNPYFYFQHGESTSTASQLTSPASQKSKDLNKVSLLLQDLDPTSLDDESWKSFFFSVLYRQVKARSCKRSKTLFQKSLLLFLTWREYFYSQQTHFSSKPKK